MAMNSTLKAECARLVAGEAAKGRTIEWTSEQSAIVAMRTVLVELGCKAELGPEHAEARKAIVEALKPLFTAPINFRRTHMVTEKLLPELPKSAKVSALVEEYC